jgi:hypothetical protein
MQPTHLYQYMVTIWNKDGERCVRARERTILDGSLKPPRLSTPWALTFWISLNHTSRIAIGPLCPHTSFDSASAPISAALPLITVGCHASSSSNITFTDHQRGKFLFLFFPRHMEKDSLAALVRRNAVAPTPTGSNTIGLPFWFACLPAESIPSSAPIVPKLISKPPGMRARSACSASASVMMGDPPSASVTLADCVLTTLFVI